MAKIFTKLNVGDAVATSGTRVFKKLTTEEVAPSLPVWNGTDLTGTTWVIKSGWSAEAGYGVFNIEGMAYTEQFGLGIRGLFIGYESVGNAGETLASSNSVTLNTLFYPTITPTEERELRIWGGTDATNTRLISWLLENAELTSHRFAPGLYDADNNLVASWDTLINTYGMYEKWDWSKDFWNGTQVSGSPTSVLHNNSELANGTKFVIDSSIEYIDTSAFANCTMLTDIHIPEGVKEIYNSAFFECTSLESVTLPDSVEFLGQTVFCGCTNLKSITIGKGMKEIRSLAFYECPNLTDAYYRGTEEEWADIWGTLQLGNATIHYNYTG